MKNIKSVTIAALAAFTMSSVVIAQAPGSGPKAKQNKSQVQNRMQKQMQNGGGDQQEFGRRRFMPILERILAKLNITPEQRKQINTINQTHQGEMVKLRQAVKSGEITKEAAMQKSRELNKQRKTSIMNVLTPAQQEEFKRLLKQLRNRRMNGNEQQGKGQGQGLRKGQDPNKAQSL